MNIDFKKSNDNLLFIYSTYEKQNIIDVLSNSDKKHFYYNQINKNINILKKNYKNFIHLDMDEIFPVWA